MIRLNGVEVARSGMPEGPVTPETLALHEKGADDRHDLELPADALQRGENCLAVEIHQRGEDSADIRFALELVGETGP